MIQQYLPTILEVYRRGYEKRNSGKKGVPEMKEHYFKVKDDLLRVQVVLGFLHGIVPAGQCQTLFDVGSGRGVFLVSTVMRFPGNRGDEFRHIAPSGGTASMPS